MPTRRHIPPRAGRTVWAFLGFLLLFVLLILLVSHYYLLPALAAYPHVSPAWRRKMSADALLLCVLLLVILLCGLMLTVRIGRFFFPRPTAPRTRTRHVDAWAEAGRRASEADAPEADDEDQPHG
jgi:hypothetical protein